MKSHKCPVSSSKIFSRGGRLQSRYRRKPREKRMLWIKQKLKGNFSAEDFSDPDIDGDAVSENVPTIEIIVFPMDPNNSEPNHGLKNVLFPVEQEAKEDDSLIIRTEGNDN
ncbi:hypothetical protein PR048_021254 [Dryococelus australis]|uniref:Uncharacterized protein n=1 Tax=Dryococelus australis TaxID=614101 RepID=A0ABQ9GXR3_9NEOP|nr:hypothetical protein PR048_021254 [Dryococelus australis]